MEQCIFLSADENVKNDKLPGSGPSTDALQHAASVQRKAVALGFDWPDAGGALGKLEEELAEVRGAFDAGRVAEARLELGDLLFSAVNLARFLEVCPRDALEGATAKFERRFAAVCRRVTESGGVVERCSLAELDAHWDAVKAVERASEAGLDMGPDHGAHCPPRNC
jgi:ATP diphosphatase